MQKPVIQLLNLSLLIVILIGIPVVSSLTFGSLRLTSQPTLQQLTVWGLALGAAANLAGACFLVKGRPARKLCFRWLCVHLLFLGFELLLFTGHISFDWLKEFLLWLKRRF